MWFIVVLVILIGPFLLGDFLAKKLRMPDYGWKLGVIFLTFAMSATLIAVKWPPKMGIDLRGGVILIYEIDKSQLKPGTVIDKTLMDQMVPSISKRVNPGGQKEVSVRQYGPEQIEIILPDVNDAEKDSIKEVISKTGRLEFRILANSFNPTHKEALELAASETEQNKTYLPDEKNWIARWVPLKEGERFDPKVNKIRPRKGGGYDILVVRDPQNVTGDYLQNAKSESDPENLTPCVGFTFDSTGGQLFGELTQENKPSDAQPNLRNQLGIILDGELYSAPGIRQKITDRGIITSGDFTNDEAGKKNVQKLVDVLNAGKLPAALSKFPVQELVSGPTLGQDTINKSSMAMGLSAVLVILFMVTYYRFSGGIATIALVLNMLGIVAVMIACKAAFTLTGFAALALTVGMAVDNNVLISERMREELAKGAALRMAIRNAFNRAGTTIIDCNMTHLIVAIVLFFLGSDQIKGFAIALFLGVLFSMYTAVFVTHVLFDIAERHRWIEKLKMMHIIGHTSFDFMSLFPITVTISILVTVLGLGAAFYRGVGLFDIDFTGGVSVQVLFDESQPTDVLRKELSDEKVLPDLVISDRQLGSESRGIRFDINTSNTNQEEVKKFIESKFPGKLAMNTLEVKNLGPAQPKKTAAPLRDEMKVVPPLPEATPEKAEKTEAEKPAPEKQSKLRRPTSWFAAVVAAPLFFGQVDALPAQTPDAAKAAQTAEEKPDAKSMPVLPADTAAPAPSPSADPFAGGTQADLNFSMEIDHPTVESIVVGALKELKFTPENVAREISGEGFIEGDPATAHLALKTWNIRIALPQEQAQKVFDAATKKLASEPYFPASNAIGAAVAGSTRLQAVYALLASWALIILYLWIRFQGVAFGLAAVIALVHDVLVMLGGLAFSYWLAKIPGVSEFLLIEPFKVNLPIIAAFLTIIGFSVNDTIVIFDRIREIRGKDPNLTRKMVNDATNETLSRTIITSLTVFIVVVVLYVFGGQPLRGFSFGLLIGVVTGTYSSIYVAAPILLWLVGKHKVSADHPHYEGPTS
jgi:SecD/SecF fusion protein